MRWWAVLMLCPGCFLERTGHVSAVDGGPFDAGRVDAAPMCNEGETRCNGDSVETCRGGAWEPEECPDTCVVSGGVAQCGACLENFMRCNVDDVERCDASGSWTMVEACATGCIVDGMTARCRLCADGDTRCTSDTLETCSDESWSAMSCPMGCIAAPPAHCRECTDGERRCDGNRLQECVGERWVSRDCELGCGMTGGAHCMRLLPVNIPTSGLDAIFNDTLPDIVIESAIDTTACTAAVGMPMLIAQAGAGPSICVLRGGDVTIRNTVSATGDNPLVILAWGDVRIEGDLLATGETNGAGHGTGGNDGGDGQNGEGGGGGGGACGAGGIGGARDVGTPGAAHPAGFLLSPLVGGSNGGEGGGRGGGAIQISARGRILITAAASIDVSGEGGATSATADGGRGGGSGGSVILESAVSVAIEVGARIFGGGGGGSGGGCSFGGGQAGANASGSVLRAQGGTGSTMCMTCCAGRGGDGGNFMTPAGANGATGTNEGAGGGGAGCLVFYTPAATPLGMSDTSAVVRATLSTFQ